jgi:hypothetical protein
MDGFTVCEVTRIPMLKLPGLITGVYANLKHGSNEYFYANGFISCANWIVDDKQ